MIYLIADTEKRWCKIGYSVNPSDRIKSIQTSMPFKVEILYVIEGTYQDEKILHKMFKEYYIRGEWFKYNENITKYISNRNQLPINSRIKSNKNKQVSTITEQEKVFEWLVDNYRCESNIGLIKSIKTEIANKLGIKLGTVDNAISTLSQKKLIYSTGKGSYKLNPRYAFKGSTNERQRLMKVMLELECKDC